MISIKKEIISFIDGLRGGSRSAKVKKNILGSFGVKGVSIIISLILVPLTIGYVSSELYGIWLTLVTVITSAQLFDLGFGNGVRNKITESIAREDWGKARKYVSTAYFYFTLLFVPISILLYFICPLVNWVSLLNVNPQYHDLIIQVMRIIIVFFCLSMIINIQTTVMRALQLNFLASAFGALGQVVVLVATYILTITTEPSLVYLAYAISAGPVLVNAVCSIWFYCFKYKQLAPSVKLVDSLLMRDVLNLGLKFFVLQIAVLVLYQTMNIIISHVAGPESVTEYNVIYKYISIPMLATTMIVDPFWSAFTDAYALKDYGWMQRSYKKLLIMFLCTIFIVVIMTILYPVAFKFWLGDKVEIHLSMVLVVAAYVLIMIWQSIHSALLNGTGCIKVSLYCSVVMTIVNIPLALFLGQLCGAMGVVISVGGLNLISGVLVYIQAKRLVENRASGIWIK